MTYELRAIGRLDVGVISSIEYCGYSVKKLLEIMKAGGYRYYVDGRMVSAKELMKRVG